MLIKSNPWGPLKRSFNTNWMSLMALEEGSVSGGGRPLTLLVTRAEAQWCCIFPVTVNYHDIVYGGSCAAIAPGATWERKRKREIERERESTMQLDLWSKHVGHSKWVYKCVVSTSVWSAEVYSKRIGSCISSPVNHKPNWFMIIWIQLLYVFSSSERITGTDLLSDIFCYSTHQRNQQTTLHHLFGMTSMTHDKYHTNYSLVGWTVQRNFTW